MSKLSDELEETRAQVERMKGFVPSLQAYIEARDAAEAGLRAQLEAAEGGLTEEQQGIFDTFQSDMTAATDTMVAAITANPVPGEEPEPE